MESPGNRTPLKSMTPRPIAESEVAFSVQLDKLANDDQYAQPRSAMTDATVVVPPPTVSPPILNAMVLPMRSVPEARYTESRTFVEQQDFAEQRFAGQQQRFSEERFLVGQKLLPEQIYQGQGFSEQQQQFSEQRFSEQRISEQQLQDQRFSEQRISQQLQYPDHRYQDGRLAEHQNQHQSHHQNHHQSHYQNHPGQQYPNPAYPGPNLVSTAPPTSTTEIYPPRPPSMQLAAPNISLDVKSVKANCHHQLQEVIRLRRQRHGFLGANSNGGGELEWQIRNQTGLLLGQLKTLQAEVRKLAKGAQNHRWRRWLIGGFIATFIPLIRRFFRRGTDLESRSSSNNTEYAFRRSKSLISRIKQNVLRHGHWASMAFFVFSVLFVFSNEVVFRVSKTIYKRIRKLVAKIEYSNDELTDKDLKVLEGWRWRIMLW